MTRVLRGATLALAPISLGLALLAAGALVVAHLVPLPGRLSASPSPLAGAPPPARASSPGGASRRAAALSADGRWRLRVTRADVDPRYLAALLHLEDRRFRTHPGVDPLALVRAALANRRAGRVVQGGSTLTMQLAGLLEPRPRTHAGKLAEALRALQLELRLGKEGVLDAYLTFAPFGRNVEGVSAASLAYFGHDARRLSHAEIATLLALAQAPSSRLPVGAGRERLRRGRNQILEKLVQARVLPAEIAGVPFPPRAALDHARQQPLPRLSLERLTPTVSRTSKRSSASGRLGSIARGGGGA